MLFGNSEHGDITSKISGYFDTNIGPKQEKESYEKIIKEVGCEPLEILFLTDIVNGNFTITSQQTWKIYHNFHITEAVAAKQTGIQVAILVREGNGLLTDEDKAGYQLYTSFDDINVEFASGKRKLDEILTAEVNWFFHCIFDPKI